MNAALILFHLDKGVASVGALDEGEGVAFAGLDPSEVAVGQVDSVVCCQSWISVFVDLQVVTRGRLSWTVISKELVERIETFWSVSQGSHQRVVHGASDLREHVG